MLGPSLVHDAVLSCLSNKGIKGRACYLWQVISFTTAALYCVGRIDLHLQIKTFRSLQALQLLWGRLKVNLIMFICIYTSN